MWVYIQQDVSRTGRVSWEVYADPAFNIDLFDLDLFIDGKEYCNASPIYADFGPIEMGCEGYEQRSNEPRMHALVRDRPMTCGKHNDSTRTSLVYACRWR